MRDYTTDELIKANRLCMGSECAGEECCFYHDSDYCPISLRGFSAKRLESQQKEIAEFKKQIAEYDLNSQIRARDEALKRRKARNVLLEEENEKLKKQISETYTAEQFIKDLNRMYGIDGAYGSANSPEKIREWAKSHPEKPKVTNAQKYKEVFGVENDSHCYVGNGNTCPTARTTCELCEYGENAEYKEPSDK